MDTVTPGSTAPVASRTVPATPPVVRCAAAGSAMSRQSAARAATAMVLGMVTSCERDMCGGNEVTDCQAARGEASRTREELGATSDPVPAAAALLAHEPDALQDHALVGRLHHVVDGQRGHGHGVQRFHL